MTPSSLIHDDEVLEALTDDLQILQKRRGFRFGLEPVLLAAFAKIASNARVADFGTGTGILPLLLHSRKKGASFDAIELAEPIADMAQRTMQLNGLTDRIRIHCCDVCAVDSLLSPAIYDAVVCNPPYRRGTPSSDPLRALAMCLPSGGLREWYRAAKNLLKAEGTLHLVIPTDLLQQTECELKAAGFYIDRQWVVHHSAEKPPMLILLSAVQQVDDDRSTETLVLYEPDGTMTKQAKMIYRLEDDATEKTCET